ncbi:hypothetical protein ACJ73_02645 [Blastomyces percursus]|uniref:Potassium transport protein n=1 Tax=Blastomyces percursus TaxID=1658174 RepID=A0A1J9RE89_9EURO|nr:hypothetical protein ACJ73_02645 [Blastomyces percursus]
MPSNNSNNDNDKDKDNENVNENENNNRNEIVPNENENAKTSTVENDDSTISTSTPDLSAPPDSQPSILDQISSSPDKNNTERSAPPAHISFSAETNMEPRGRALRIPGPREFESGQTVREVDDEDLMKSITIEETPSAGPSGETERRRLPTMGRLLSHAASVERAASNAFILGNSSRKRSRSRSSNPLNRSSSKSERALLDMPYLSYQPTIGRNSKFLDLTDEQRDELGGIEYRSLKLLAKIVFCYYVFWHIFGVICLIGWIYNSDRKYRDYIRSVGQNPTWWAIFSSMTAYNNLGFTLTPDSMTSFRNATFPIFIMTFLIYIGNTGYPCMLRLIIWIMFKISPRDSAIREPLNFLLDHPRRCYTLLFPSSPTWMLFFSLVFLNFIDVLLFLVLDLHNEEVLAVPSSWNRFLAALFQAASARTTGTSTFNVSKVHPAVQFMLMVMMYISVFPIAISVRRTNTYEENSLGLYDPQSDEIDESNSTASYVGAHMKKQLAFDLWYVFFGMFILMITEGSKLADKADPARLTFNPSPLNEPDDIEAASSVGLNSTTYNTGDVPRTSTLSNAEGAQWNREMLLQFKAALEKNPAADLLSMFPNSYHREHRNSQYPQLSFAARINLQALNELHDALRSEPEVNLLAPELRTRFDLAETASIIFPLSETVDSLLAQSGGLAHTELGDAEQSLLLPLKSLLWDSTKIWENLVRGVVVKCNGDIVAKVVTGNTDYTEYTTLQFLAERRPRFPHQDRMVWSLSDPFRSYSCHIFRA